MNIPVVIMAGGLGSRMRPLTNVIPKPLLPFNDKTIVEEIMGKFMQAGCDDFFLSVNYMADMIKYYFANVSQEKYKITYFQEIEPLGTAGSLSLLKGKITSTFFVSNCDIIVDQDLSTIYEYHKENRNLITLVSALKMYNIPYGSIETKNGFLESLTEKPELTFQINTGLYIVEPELIYEIPEGEFFHITDLIYNIRSNGGKIGVFPISQGSWKDLGGWKNYMSNIKLDIHV